ncbi:hypothetical protein PG996_010797, partial [Apiospora saccharicola]
RTVKIPETAAQFWDFPKTQGWEVKRDFSLKALPKSNCNLAVFLQAWLFFGLCLTVVQRDSNPILSFGKLVIDSNLSTKGLNEALKEWYEWELQQRGANEDHNGLRFRMIQVSYILEYARHVIRMLLGVPLAVEDNHVLVLMCLGEALCQMKAKITQECSINMAGWHAADDQEGWGPPRFVLQKMEEENWCPRAMRLFRGRFLANATLLVSAYYACDEPENATSRHTGRNCTPNECFYTSEDELGSYCTKHITAGCTCAAFGPDPNKVLKILNKKSSVVPLLKFRNKEDEKDKVNFEVLKINSKSLEKLQFVAISHVWSHGWGNEAANELKCCQLKFIQRRIEQATGSQHTPFWMDTLTVPVNKSNIALKARMKAIRQIHSVFKASKQTIVIDNGLMSMKEGNQVETAMKILSSGWTRRLWTLQEAHLSRSLQFAFRDTLCGLPEFERQFDTVEDPAGINMKMRVKSQLFKNITRRVAVGSGPVDINLKRRLKSQLFKIIKKSAAVGNGDLSISQAATVVANTWHAARWRRLVQVFWERLHEKYEGAIPSGIIFLPGDKVNIQGYSWAPKTCLSAHEVTYPDPMSFWNPPTELFDDDGLLVHYPGFILHTTCPETRDGILGIAAMPDESSQLSFPVDKTLNEWYAFTKAEEHSYTTFENLQRSTSKLAIIAARLPEELPRESALLVEIKESRPPKADCGPDAKEYCVKVVRRLYIWRRVKTSAEVENRKNSLKTGNSRSQGTKDFLIAEKLEPRQRWWVDGYVTPNPPPEVLKKQESQQVKTSSWKGVEASILSRFLGQSEPVRPAETQTE